MSEQSAPSKLSNFINNAFVPPQDNKYIDNVNPATNTVNSLIPDSDATDVQAAVDAALAALASPQWSYTHVTGRQRSDWLRKIADAIEARVDEFALAESMDTGKPLSFARTVDIPRSIENFRFFSDFGRHFSDSYTPSDLAGGFNYTARKPVGVVGLITPWNLPLYLLSWKVAPALMMGNTIVCKPSEMTPTTASLLAEVMASVGLPAGVFNIVHGVGPRAGQAIVEHRHIKAISFTGGTITGGRVAATAGQLFKKLSLELGGKNPNVIFADCDLEKAVETSVRSSFANSGQICLCGSRIYVQDSIYDSFLEKFVAKVKSTVRVGPPQESTTTMGSVISFQHLAKIEGMVKTAIEQEGGVLLLGGDRPSGDWAANGAYLNPTIITGLPQECSTVQEEIFGPVVSVHRFSTESEALELANGVRYGLAATVWTRDLERAHRFSRGLDCGIVWVNSWLVRDLVTPFGGVKDSGVGREGGRYSLEFFSECKNVFIPVNMNI